VIRFALALACWLALPAFAALPDLRLAVSLDPATRALRAVAQLPAPAGGARFELHESLRITAASTGGQPIEVRASAARQGLREWRLAAPAAAPLRIEYAGTLPALDRGKDHRGVLGALPPMASVEGGFLSSGSGWYPRPSAFFTYQVELELPPGQKGLVAGRLVDESDGAGGYRARFAFSHPADGIDLMTGPYVVREKQVAVAGAAPLRLRTYFFADLDALAEGYLEDSARYLGRYAAWIGPYPYTEFSVAAAPLPTGFGMPTLTYLGADVLRLPFIRATSLGHEVLHNWWGNGVYVDYASGNWSEGLTTFMADYAYKEDDSPQAAREMRLAWLRDLAALPADDRQTLAGFRSRTHGAAAAVGYGKSAMLFFMLRELIGQQAFDRALRDFWQRQRFRQASWDDLRAAFEQAAGRPLGAFFAQWLTRPGGPALRLTAAAAQPQPGGYRLDLDFEQGGEPHALRVPVEIVGAGRAELRRVDLARSHERHTLDLDFAPEGVRLDPDLHLWRRLEPEQLPPILRRWIVAAAPRLALAGTAPDVARAAEALARRLFETAPQAGAPAKLLQGTEPGLLIGLHADVDAALAQLGLPARPASLERGSAQAWTIQRDSGAPIAVVSGRDAASLTALLRPLPHYGAQSWVVFDGSRALDRGVWPAPGRLIPVTR
jgi:hypothetical protein